MDKPIFLLDKQYILISNIGSFTPCFKVSSYYHTYSHPHGLSPLPNEHPNRFMTPAAFGGVPLHCSFGRTIGKPGEGADQSVPLVVITFGLGAGFEIWETMISQFRSSAFEPSMKADIKCGCLLALHKLTAFDTAISSGKPARASRYFSRTFFSKTFTRVPQSIDRASHW